MCKVKIPITDQNTHTCLNIRQNYNIKTKLTTLCGGKIKYPKRTDKICEKEPTINQMRQANAMDTH